MICEKVFYPTPGDDSVYLTCYIRDESPEIATAPRDAMLVLPGGGYHACSDREAEPIALAYLNYGINAFVDFAFLNTPADAAGIASIHTVFNVIATLLLLPFSGVLEKLARLTVKEVKNPAKEKFEKSDVNRLQIA